MTGGDDGMLPAAALIEADAVIPNARLLRRFVPGGHTAGGLEAVAVESGK
ncbi:hypothetical protein K0U00_09355 [Paenibacillus sepulcri]|uniref:Uncharacterized protein n=1 Tax=Paenibacillus sepulcri TaxID=359917 RepID=A0ABS7C099_9BACL|nr:hypothetical protein [Paenibacillus sepulcri]